MFHWPPRDPQGFPKRLQSCPFVADSVAMGGVFERWRDRHKRQENQFKTQIRTSIWCFTGLRETSKAPPGGSKVALLWPILSPWPVFSKKGRREANNKQNNTRRKSALISGVPPAPKRPPEMAPNCPRRLQTAINGPDGPRWHQAAPDRPDGPRQPQTGSDGPDSPRRPQTTPNGSRRPQTASDGPRWPQTASDGQRWPQTPQTAPDCSGRP